VFPRLFQFGKNMQPAHKYARIERERRFLLDRLPTSAIAERSRRITDRYLDSTTLRLRKQNEGGTTIYKLTQKIPAHGSQPALITSMYLSHREFSVLAPLPAQSLSKIRYSLPPFGIDVFEGAL
jgi:hypothetical protein